MSDSISSLIGSGRFAGAVHDAWSLRGTFLRSARPAFRRSAIEARSNLGMRMFPPPVMDSIRSGSAELNVLDVAGGLVVLARCALATCEKLLGARRYLAGMAGADQARDQLAVGSDE